MSKFLIYGGTTEGRKIAEALSKSEISSVVCVATEYGELVMPQSKWIQVHTGRLTVDNMKDLLQTDDFFAVIDATHPFATIVSENIRTSLLDFPTIPYLRLNREIGMTEQSNGVNSNYFGKIHTFTTSKECAEALKETSGNILLTTGSKELSVFCKEESLKERLVARVLPGQESISLCYENGLQGKQIIAMQGPFSVEMNLAMIRQYNISCLVTKESGKTGGLDTKYEAAKEAGIPCYLIKKPEESEKEKSYSFQELCSKIEEMTGTVIHSKNHLEVVLAGIGMGSEDSMTVGLSRLLQRTDYLFGAERMIQGKKGRSGTYPYYLAKDIIPVLQSLQKESASDQTITILYSGDSGFFSGTRKMKKELEKMEEVSVSILPGISSISYFSARIGESWQDATIISTHGVSESKWSSLFLSSVKHKEKTFFITSGLKDIHRIGDFLFQLETEGLSFQIFLGYQLSYEDEKVWEATTKECQEMERKGLFVGMILQKNPLKKIITPNLLDESFLRDQVPMTKEEIRHLSVCKLGLKENAVVYDIGSGTGSIAIEIANQSPEIAVYAIETNPVALELISQNRNRFKTPNVTIVEGLAPEALMELETPDCAFIGGSKGNLKKIIEVLYQKNPHIRIVANAVSLETLGEFIELQKEYELQEFSVVQVAVTHTRKVGNYQMLQGENPVWICTLQF